MSEKDVWKTIEAVNRQIEKVDRQISMVTQQIGGLNNKFGSFTEGLAFPAMFKLLKTKFHCDFMAPRVNKRKGAESMELDVFAYSNGQHNEAYIVEVKSHAKDDAIDQLLNQLKQFGRFFPEHHDKKLFGILAAVDISKEVAAKASKKGIYVARISDEMFQLKVPAGFRPHSFQQKAT